MPSTEARTPIARPPYLACLGLALAASWPWLQVLELWPMAPDSGQWIERGDPGGPDWRSWVFHTRHFQVGYRPVTALTFSAGAWLSDSPPWLVRGTDLALHLAAALGLFAVLRRALGAGRGALAGAFAGLLLFLVHPGLEEVVPWSARRSYSLALALGCAGLLVASGAAGARSTSVLRGVCGGALLALALLSNEVAVGPVVFLPLLLLLQPDPTGVDSPGRRLRFALLRSLLPAAGVAAALLLRHGVVGGLGGYALDGDAEARTAGIARLICADLSGTGFLAGGGGSAGDSAVGIGWALLVGAALLVTSILRVGGKRMPGAALAAAAGLAGMGLLFASQGVWFPRQTHALLAPLALGLGALVRGALGASGPLRYASGAAAVLVLGSALAASPALFGIDGERTAEWERRQGTIDTLLSARDLEPGSRVLCVLPFEEALAQANRGKAERTRLPRDARQPLLWARYRLRDADVTVREFLYVAELDGAGADVEPVEGEPRPSVRVPLERQVLLLKTRNPRLRKPAKGPLEALPSQQPDQRGPDYLFLYGPSGGELIPAPLKAPRKR